MSSLIYINKFLTPASKIYCIKFYVILVSYYHVFPVINKTFFSFLISLRINKNTEP